MGRRYPKSRGSPLLSGKGALLTGILVLGLALWVGFQFTQTTAYSNAQTLAPSQAPDFTVATTTGEIFNLSQHRGEVVVINFMAPACPSCARALPALDKIYQEFADNGLQVLVLNVDARNYTEADLTTYSQYIGAANIMWANDQDQLITIVYRVTSLGDIYIIDRQGRLVWVGRATEYEGIKEIVESFL